MANEKHLLLTVSGDYVASALAGEFWENTMRIALVFGPVDPIGTLPDNWDPTPTTINRTETDWTISGNWSVDGPGLSTFSPDDYLNDQLADAVATLYGGSFLAPDVRVRSLKLYPIGTDGRAIPAPPYAVGSPILLTWTGSYPVGTGGGTSPPSVAIVASHRTSQVGRRGRGRIFLPSPAPGAYSTDHGVLGSSWPNTIATAMVAFYEGIAVNPGPGAEPHMEPIVTGAPYVNYSTISGCTVDNILDGQRRRKLSLTGTSATVSR